MHATSSDVTDCSLTAFQEIFFLLIPGPAQYRFSDFLRIGLPLTLLIALVSAWMARWLWLGGPLLPGFVG